MADSGLALIVLGLVLLMSKPRKLEASSFVHTFKNGSTAPNISYASYYYYATKPRDELEEGEALEEAITTSGQVGEWLTINGRIPTPRGTTIPMPTVHVGRTAVEKMLQPLEEAKEEPHFQDVAGRRSVNLRLKPL